MKRSTDSPQSRTALWEERRGESHCKLVDRAFEGAAGGAACTWRARLCFFHLPLGSFVSFRNRAVSFTIPQLQLLLPRLEDPGARRPQLRLVFLGLGGGSSSSGIGLLNRPFGPRPPLAQHPGQRAINQRTGKELRAKGTEKWSVRSRAVVRRVDVRSRPCQIFSIWVDCGRRVGSDSRDLCF